MKDAIRDFVRYWKEYIEGKEKQEAQVFLERLFVAFGHVDGIRGAGAECEFKVKARYTNTFADLVWGTRCIIEMKKRGEYLQAHYQQLFDYWLHLTPDRPRFAVLCNFDDIWIYDLNRQLYEPVEKIKIADLPDAYLALSFLFPQYIEPVFRKSNELVTKEAAYLMAHTFKSFRERGINPDDALRYCMQCILAMFAQDIDLLPNKLFYRIISGLEKETNHGKLGYQLVLQSYDVMKGLFAAMNTKGGEEQGLMKGVPYFNGGLFENVKVFELTVKEISNLFFASQKNWQKVNPSIFGSVFEQGLEKDERHVLGAHYTSEADIQKIVYPCIVEPWLRKIAKAQTLDDLYFLLYEIVNYKVLDPACGSGNFLFVAFKELKGIENQLLNKVRELSKSLKDAKRLSKFLQDYPFVSTKQFYGMDKNKYAVELAKLALVIAKEMTYFDYKEAYDNKQSPLPLDNLNENILCIDALFQEDGIQRDWGVFDAIIGNPPFQARSKMLSEFGADYINKLRKAYPNINRYADYCVHWFYKAHIHLKENGYAGLIGTNTIRENNSRESSLDYIVANGGDIFNAVSSQPWEGEAVVYVSIVNWKKGEYEYDKFLTLIRESGEFKKYSANTINTDLKEGADVTIAQKLKCNLEARQCYMGQKHGHKGFLLEKKEAIMLIAEDSRNAEVLKPYLNGDEFLSNLYSQPKRFVIDFDNLNGDKAKSYKKLFEIIVKKVLPDRKALAEKQEEENKVTLEKNPNYTVNKSYIQYYKTWWQLIGKRPDLVERLGNMKRYIVCSAVSKRNIFDFVSTEIRPNAALIAFLFEDDYSFGILQSKIHWEWWKAKGSTLKGDYRYTIDSVWETFPFPQNPTKKQVEYVAECARKLRWARNESMQKNKLSLRDIYRNMEIMPSHPVSLLHEQLDRAVWEAYGFDDDYDLLQQILALNSITSLKEKNNDFVLKAGLPDWIKDKESFISDDCIRLIS